ncbi:MAG: hypothetical protein KatS3mg093_098 [Candidatus Parcubacteria bacterium]|nr:MAG: hypothetical protein KatS3mg093_098 [Candidatus Parcubacteria bacterium]
MAINKKIITIIIIAIIFVFIVFVGYFASRNKNVSDNFIEKKKEEDKKALLPITNIEEKNANDQSNQSLSSTAGTSKNVPQQLLKENVFYLGIVYPELYVYDYDNEVIKVINLKEDTYKEIYRASNVQKAYLSPFGSKIIIDDGRFNLLDLATDKLFNLSSAVKNFVFTDKDLIVYVNNDEGSSYLGYFKDGEIKKIRNLGIMEPEFIFIPGGKILIYQHKNSAPVFLLDLTSSKVLSIFLEPANNYSLLLNNFNKKLLFVSSAQGSKIINLDNKETLFSFDWQTVKEKCTFDRLLICAVSSNFDVDDWYLLGENYDNKIVIFDPEKKEIVKEISLASGFDVLAPTLFDSKIIFANRLNSKIYSLEIGL